MRSIFEFSSSGREIIPRFNIAPTTQIPVIRLREDGQRELIEMRWGLVPLWSRPGDKLPLLINARAETVSSKPAFREAFKSRRCIVPASGYYEWQKLPGGAKQPFYITRRDGLPIGFAGLWENAKEVHGTVAIVTTAASEETQQIHDRMPVILGKPDFARWLASEPLGKQEAGRLLASPPAGSLVAWAVSTRVNNVRHDDAGLINEIEPGESVDDRPFLSLRNWKASPCSRLFWGEQQAAVGNRRGGLYFLLHPKSPGLADEGELGFMKSVEAQFEKIVVAKAKGAGEQTANLAIDSFHLCAGQTGVVKA